jgi:hypothetical protein
MINTKNIIDTIFVMKDGEIQINVEKSQQLFPNMCIYTPFTIKNNDFKEFVKESVIIEEYLKNGL